MYVCLIHFILFLWGGQNKDMKTQECAEHCSRLFVVLQSGFCCIWPQEQQFRGWNDFFSLYPDDMSLFSLFSHSFTFTCLRLTWRWLKTNKKIWRRRRRRWSIKKHFLSRRHSSTRSRRGAGWQKKSWKKWECWAWRQMLLFSSRPGGEAAAFTTL